MAQSFVYNFTRATATGSVAISTSATLLASVAINTPGLPPNSFQLYNGTDTSTAGTAGLVATIIPLGTATGLGAATLTYNIWCPNGLFLNNTGGTSPDATVTWS